MIRAAMINTISVIANDIIPCMIIQSDADILIDFGIVYKWFLILCFEDKPKSEEKKMNNLSFNKIPFYDA
jgi:hypothetical protein